MPQSAGSSHLWDRAARVWRPGLSGPLSSRRDDIYIVYAIRRPYHSASGLFLWRSSRSTGNGNRNETCDEHLNVSFW